MSGKTNTKPSFKVKLGGERDSSLLSTNVLCLVKDDSLVLDLEPFHGILLGDPVLNPNSRFAPPTTTNTVSRALQNHIEVHTINTSGWVIPARRN